MSTLSTFYLPDMEKIDRKITYIFYMILGASSRSKNNNAEFTIDELIKYGCNDENPNAIVKTYELREIINLMYHTTLLTKIITKEKEEKYRLLFR